MTEPADAEFYRLLRLIWKDANLSFGQVHCKTGIARSQIHALIMKERKRIPRSRSQVQALIEACDPSADEAAAVLALWDHLRHLQRRGE
ncbi:hypothetical protein [Lentzea cavernae]|uniref:XRE family transcriptional regulator n=1 Tax=Lentzea cavernae TaxID=2020703 RepID=A0ABQ3MMU5_9PSEU|nr:hypothetical protein [Lentzea cavernae]GHH49436.1 hypothetical protein GCM10017774_56850 [Lentzea cavernae]